MLLAGKSVPRVDALLKATGELKFADDLYFNNMLYTKVFRSSVPHAEIIKIDFSEALRTEGVVKVLTAKDIPGENQIGGIIQDEELLADKKVHFVGQPIAFVIADNQLAAHEAADLIEYDFIRN